jgi:hypothetical protein
VVACPWAARSLKYIAPEENFCEFKCSVRSSKLSEVAGFSKKPIRSMTDAYKVSMIKILKSFTTCQFNFSEELLL